MSSLRFHLRRALPIACASAWLLTCKPSDTGPIRAETGEPVRDAIPMKDFGEGDLVALADAVPKLLAGSSVEEVGLPNLLSETKGGVFVAFRAKGEELAEVWGPDGDMASGLAGAIEKAKLSAGDRLSEVDMVEIDFAHDFETLEEKLDAKRVDKLGGNRNRGVRGFELRYDDKTFRIAPTQTIADNLRISEDLERIMKAEGIAYDDLVAKGDGRWFAATQVIVVLGDTPRAVELFRGHEYVEPSEVTQESTRNWARLAGDWLIHHVRDDGRMTYLWFPANSTEDDTNNMIRQWMATNALEKVAADREDPAVWDLIEKNIDYNLEKFYLEEEGTGVGYIFHENASKLGANSLAAMALVGHPKRDKWAKQSKALLAGIDELHNDDGSFDTFYKPRSFGGANVHNFYPGETLLLWSVVYMENRDPVLLEKFMKSFQYYSKWHMEHRKPSFIPWHTQAYYNVWTVTKDQALADFVFEMNDWLIEVMQQWDDDEIVNKDEKGQFFSREHEDDDFGPPHASSTGVYVEGLIDAYRMAKELGDETRTERYRLSLARAMRSLIELQFADEIGMYYVTNRDMAMGGIRTTQYRSEIRVDNVQHPLMGVIKLLREFEPSDYRTD